MNQERVRVLQVGKFYPPHRGGMETHLEVLCDGLSRSCEVTAIVANDGPRTASGYVRDVSVTRVAALGHVASTAISPGMVREIRTHPADIIHIHWPNPTAVAAYFASRHRGRLVMTYHSDVVRQKTLARVIRPLLTAALKRADAVIVTSRRYAETSSVLRSFIHKCRVIPFGLDSALYEAFDRARAGHIRAEYGPQLLLAVGRHVYYKGFEYLIAAMRDVRGKVLMAGDGPLRSRLAALAARHGVDDRVVFLGEVDDLVPYYHAADAVVLPSITRNEAFGIVQMEAMACGRPVINTALDSTVPLVSLHGKTGLTVTPKNVGELASAMNLLLDDERLRLQYGTAARRRVETEFTAERMTSRTLDLYRQIIGGTKTQHAVDNFAACI